MSALLRLFWEICTFRRGPQDTPYSRSLFSALLIVYLIVGLLIYLIPDSKGSSYTFNQIMTFLLVDTIAWMGLIYLILHTHNYAARSLQTLTSMLACEIIINVAQVPIILIVSSPGGQSESASLIMVFGTMLIFLWELAIYTHIFRNALSISIFKAGGYALMLFFLHIVINLRMLPVTN